MNTPIKHIFFEIVGKCNAKCTYCITGNGTQRGGIVDLEEAEGLGLSDEDIEKLKEKMLVGYKSKSAS